MALIRSVVAVVLPLNAQRADDPMNPAQLISHSHPYWIVLLESCTPLPCNNTLSVVDFRVEQEGQ